MKTHTHTYTGPTNRYSIVQKIADTRSWKKNSGLLEHRTESTPTENSAGEQEDLVASMLRWILEPTRTHLQSMELVY